MAGLSNDRHPGGRNVWDEGPFERFDLFHLVVFARQDEGGDGDIGYRTRDIFVQAFLRPSVFSS
jgi:hypothetical protein